MLDLPVADSVSLASLWKAQLLTIADRFASSPVPVRVVQTQQMPALAAAESELGVEALRITACGEPEGLRGTGGILRDLATEYADDALLLIASAAALLLEPLERLVDELLATDADVAFHVHEDGSASTIMVVRAGCLRSIPPIGFIDLKEQALSNYIDSSAVAIVRTSQPVAASMRSPSRYLRALRLYHRRRGQREHANRIAFAEDWRPVFGVREPGAELGSNVRLHDAVVLAGARVGAGAVIARSVICPGAKIAANATVVDRILTGEGERSISAATGQRR
jgi:hypothetical protein